MDYGPWTYYVGHFVGTASQIIVLNKRDIYHFHGNPPAENKLARPGQPWKGVIPAVLPKNEFTLVMVIGNPLLTKAQD